MTLRTQFTAIENAVLFSRKLSHRDKIFYAVLRSFRNEETGLCCPSMRTVAKKARIGINNAYACRENLKELKVLSWKNKRGRGHSPHYRFELQDCPMQKVGEILKNLKGE